ncbi:MAG: hypothetical protein AAF598_14810, partial [Bacteroidota bacterium]
MSLILLTNGFLFAQSPNLLQATDCIDLAISEVKIIKETRGKLTLDITFRNLGNAPFSFSGDPDQPRYLAIQFFFSGDDYLNRGDVFADGHFISPKILSQAIRWKENINPGKSISLQ